ncbi:MAG: CcrColossus [Alphaproteobacteria bacterium]|jgi:NH3-dependent NAD+ synthetase|nr:CcrColossus [Alphaproteobacteria bacterium]
MLQPRKINPGETFQRLVSWIKNRAVKDKMPGIIVGVSGTDSLVVFLAAYAAFKELGKPQAVMAVNFAHPGSLQKSAEGTIACTAGDGKDWFARQIMPWLRQVAPDASYVLDDTIEFSDDNKRWGNIFSRAISDTALNHGMLGNYRLVAGTRNRTEAVLGTYTLLSRNPSLQPIEHLYKTQILAICEYLDVPQIAVRKSREVDCDCGRFEVQANHLDALDHYIMAQQGDLDPAFLETIDPDTLAAVRNFYIEERENNAFREKIPYRPTPTKTVYQGEDIDSALQAVAGDADLIKSVSMVTPRIIIDNDSASAHKLVMNGMRDKSAWQAEAFALMGTTGLSPDQKCDMLNAVFGAQVAALNEKQVDALAKISGRIGQYGFSFPAKRFTTQSFAAGPSLVERAGFTRQTRASDIRDASLPKSNPQ